MGSRCWLQLVMDGCHCRGSSAFREGEAKPPCSMPPAWLPAMSQHCCHCWGCPAPGSWALFVAERALLGGHHSGNSCQCPPLLPPGRGRSKWPPKRVTEGCDEGASFPSDMPKSVFFPQILTFRPGLLSSFLSKLWTDSWSPCMLSSVIRTQHCPGLPTAM